MEEQSGYNIAIKDMNDLSPIKAQYNVPTELQSCHTAIVDGYVIEGHVPVAEVERLLAERPNVAGIAVPGMPINSPGMEVEGRPDDAYQVFTFDQTGKTEVFASYPK
ncbi:DUF411 domain-containing protein [Anaerolineales bacterium HSG6]|nr:DUF411 domain-containing protein [Anaerolineales bacterium HSG6]MDM8532878.1 DUF411 domain-containing protein [Anaerolineales bacterium HSG25]